MRMLWMIRRIDDGQPTHCKVVAFVLMPCFVTMLMACEAVRVPAFVHGQMNVRLGMSHSLSGRGQAKDPRRGERCKSESEGAGHGNNIAAARLGLRTASVSCADAATTSESRESSTRSPLSKAP